MATKLNEKPIYLNVIAISRFGHVIRSGYNLKMVRVPESPFLVLLLTNVCTSFSHRNNKKFQWIILTLAGGSIINWTELSWMYWRNSDKFRSLMIYRTRALIYRVNGPLFTVATSHSLVRSSAQSNRKEFPQIIECTLILFVIRCAPS